MQLANDLSTVLADPSIRGLAGGIGGAAVAAFFFRKKTRAETANLSATATDTIAHGAATIVQISVERILDLENRLRATELRAAEAHEAAKVARAAEAECSRRLSLSRRYGTRPRRRSSGTTKRAKSTKVPGVVTYATLKPSTSAASARSN